MHPGGQQVHGEEGKAPRSPSPATVICRPTEPNHRKLWKRQIMGMGPTTQPSLPGVSPVQGRDPMGCCAHPQTADSKKQTCPPVPEWQANVLRSGRRH